MPQETNFKVSPNGTYIDGNNFKEVAGFEGVGAGLIDDLKADDNHILISMDKRNRKFFDVYKLIEESP